jgi:ribosomal-protein-alanine N-acetyltransferase
LISGTGQPIVEIDIRRMSTTDLTRVVALERNIFTDPWPRSAFEDALKDRDWGALVAECDGGLAGYALYLIVDVEAHLTNIAVAPEYRRKSVAKRLLEHIFTLVEVRKCDFLLLEVRPSNREAIAFYEQYGFQDLYRRPNYYRRPVEDAMVMVRYFD